SEILEAKVVEPIYPNSRGRIKCQGVYYRAEFFTSDYQEPIFIGQRVLVVALRGNTALIKPKVLYGEKDCAESRWGQSFTGESCKAQK
ncbi:MAG: NfeD family protein, partial [Chloroflexota bacterium]